MIDNRTNVSRWHELCKGFSSDIRFLHSKPYLHGGAGTICNFSDFPKDGIKLGGIADTDLSEHFLHLVDDSQLKLLTHHDWPIRINSESPVFHPIEKDIFNWTIKYLMYQIAWENTFKSFLARSSKAGAIWQDRMDQNRNEFHTNLEGYLKSLPAGKILERAFMRSYYSVVRGTKNKRKMYEELRTYRSRSYVMK